MGPAHRILPALVLLCMVPASSASPPSTQADDPLTPEERAWLDQNGPIRYATEPAYAPFEFTAADGTVEGINMDLLNRMSRNLGIEFQVVLYDNWTAVLDAMRSGEAQMVGAVAPTPERETYMDFVGPYMSFGEVFYVNVARDDLRDDGDLSGRRVAVVRDYAAAGWLAEHRPDVERVLVPDILTGLEAVSTGSVDAFFENVPVTGYHIRQHAINNVRILGDPLYYSPANWGVAEGEDLLAAIVSKGLDSIPLGEQTAVFEFWTGYDLGVQSAAVATPGPLFSTAALAVMGGLLAVVVGAGAWTWSLRSAVRHKTLDLSESRDEVRRANQHLESRVRERTRELRLLMEREARLYDCLAEAAERMTGRVDRVAQELRDRHQGALRPRTLMLLDAAQSAAWEFAEMVGAAAETARIEPDDPHAGEVALGSLLRGAVEAAARRHPRTPVLACEGDLPVRGDPRALARLAGHLAAFAVASEASALHASAALGGVRLVLTGCAVAVDDPAALLEPLREPGRVGLSLPAVARILHRNGGDVEARRDGGDLVLTLRFPGA